jgi:hypothetical protein
MPYTPRDRGGRPTVGLGFAAENLDVAEANIEQPKVAPVAELEGSSARAPPPAHQRV